MAITQIRNEQLRPLTIELDRLVEGAELIKRNGSVAFTGTVNANSNFVSNVLDPQLPQDAATKAYVDATAQGLFPKASVRVISRENITLSGTQTVDGVLLNEGDRVLVAGQTSGSENGIYVVASGTWARSDDANTDGKVKAGLFTFVTEGSVNQDSGWVLATDNPIFVGTTSLLFTQFSGAGQISAGDGITKTGNTLNVVTAGSDRIVVNADSIDLATAGVQGTYNIVTTDQYGRTVSAFLRTLTAGTTGLSITDGDGVNANPIISLAGDVVAIANITGNGLVSRTATGTMATRTIQGTSNQITLADGDGVSGNPTVSLTDFGTSGTYNVVITDSKGRVESAFLRSLTSASTAALTITNADGTSGNPTITVDADLIALANLTTMGFAARTAADTWTTRIVEVGIGLSITNADGILGNPSIALQGSLSALANLSSTGIIVQTAVGTVASRTLISNATALTISNADGISGNPTFDIDADLKAVAALTTNGFAVRTAADTWTTRAIQGTTGTIVVTNGDATSADPVITLDTVTDDTTGTFLKFTRDSYGRVQGTTAVVLADIKALADDEYINTAGDTLTGFLTLHADPADSMHAVTKQYVDAVATGLDLKASVRAATVNANIDLATGGTLTVDGVALAVGDRVLVKNQTDATENGIYVVAAGEWLRATDADGTPDSEVTSGMFTFIEDGVVNGDNGWTLVTNDPIVLGTTPLQFTQFTGAGQVIAGDGVTKSGNTINVVSASASRIVVNADSIDLAQTGVSAGNYNVTNVDIYGRVTAAFLRSLTSASTAALTITNADGVAGDPTITVDADLVALANISSTGFAVRTAADTWTTRSVVSNAVALTVTNGDAVAGNVTLDLDSDLVALAALTTNGISIRTADGAWATRAVDVGTGLSVTNADGINGNITINMVGSLSSLANLSGLGFVVQTASDSVASRTIEVDTTTGLSIANGDGIAGNPSISTVGALNSLANLTATGIVVQTVTGTIAARSVVSNNSLISVTNGDAVAANPTLDLELNTDWIIRGNGSNKGQAYRSVFNEIAITSDNITYSLLYSLVEGTEQVYINGLLQRVGSNYDYTIVSGQIVFNAANQSVDTVQVTYYATN
jgi:hypothetical protein